ncbi:hypothetical protein [Arcobacter acticola]|uniref:hypothetical protein n=1 Tax=Arcobacter acticola TaxID=1849015 RepID=UPI00155801DB|nr:hypothetical protein [Arcobacter acticola]
MYEWYLKTEKIPNQVGNDGGMLGMTFFVILGLAFFVILGLAFFVILGLASFVILGLDPGINVKFQT